MPMHPTPSSIEQRLFGTASNGHNVDEYTLTNSQGATAKVITYGAIISSLTMPDMYGAWGDVVLGFDNLKQYEERNPFFGATVGRVGNRIANGQFSLDGCSYALVTNNGRNHLHGGMKGYDKRIWTADSGMTTDGPAVRLTLVDDDGTEGYPGTVRVTAVYTLTHHNALKIQYFATTDKPTPINLTNHSYFNLADGGKTEVLGHVLELYADEYLPVDEGLIPVGPIAPVRGTPIDFTSPKTIGKDIAEMRGYDHNMVVRVQGFSQAADVFEPQSGRRMEVWTTEPGVQFYSGNNLHGPLPGKDGAIYGPHKGLCLETQHFPDSVNHPEFPSVILRPGNTYRHITEYRFFTGPAVGN